MKHDVFISHASEDEGGFCRSPANALTKAGVKVWYDKFALAWGDTLRGTIDRGLATCRYGIVRAVASLPETKEMDGARIGWFVCA